MTCPACLLACHTTTTTHSANGKRCTGTGKSPSQFFYIFLRFFYIFFTRVRACLACICIIDIMYIMYIMYIIYLLYYVLLYFWFIYLSQSQSLTLTRFTYMLHKGFIFCWSTTIHLRIHCLPFYNSSFYSIPLTLYSYPYSYSFFTLSPLPPFATQHHRLCFPSNP